MFLQKKTGDFSGLSQFFGVFPSSPDDSASSQITAVKIPGETSGPVVRLQPLRKWRVFEAQEVVPISMVAMGAGGSVTRSQVTPVVPGYHTSASRRKLPVSFRPVVPMNTKKVRSKLERLEKLKLMKKMNGLLIAEKEQETWICFVPDFLRIRSHGVHHH